MGVLTGLKPERVFYYFEELSQLQRGSGYEKPVSDYLVSFAKSRGFEVYQDDIFNILIKAPGTAGGENAEPIILHGHMDIVWKKDDHVEHDFFKDPIKLYIEDGFVKARGTTLGADNGIGIAYMLALLEGNIPHPPIECIITVMEEMGKRGAAVYDTSKLTAKRMIDFNWIDDKQILVGCSGDISCKITMPVLWETPDQGLTALDVFIDGMRGGHCEFDIHLERGNSIILLARVLDSLQVKWNIQIASIGGGVQNNVIPSESFATILVHPDDKVHIIEEVEKLNLIFKNEYQVSDPDVQLRISHSPNTPEKIIVPSTSKVLVSMIPLIPNGVIRMSQVVEGNVETSNNLGILEMINDEISMITTITSAITSYKQNVVDRIAALVDLAGHGAQMEIYGVDAPEFTFNPNSELLKIAQGSYEKAMGKKPELQISVASLQLGFFIQSMGVDTIGIGTEIYDTHNSRERMSIASVERVWNLIQELMKDLTKSNFWYTMVGVRDEIRAYEGKECC